MTRRGGRLRKVKVGAKKRAEQYGVALLTAYNLINGQSLACLSQFGVMLSLNLPGKG